MDAAGVAGEGDPAHGVRQVPVEAREEAEAVLAGKRLAVTRSGPGDVHGAGLAAESVVVLVDRDLVAAFGEFVGRAEAGDPAAEDGDAFAGGGRGRAAGEPLRRRPFPRRRPRRPLARSPSGSFCGCVRCAPETAARVLLS